MYLDNDRAPISTMQIAPARGKHLDDVAMVASTLAIVSMSSRGEIIASLLSFTLSAYTYSFFSSFFNGPHSVGNIEEQLSTASTSSQINAFSLVDEL
jgi:hypothetical protein